MGLLDSANPVVETGLAVFSLPLEEADCWGSFENRIKLRADFGCSASSPPSFPTSPWSSSGAQPRSQSRPPAPLAQWEQNALGP